MRYLRGVSIFLIMLLVLFGSWEITTRLLNRNREPQTEESTNYPGLYWTNKPHSRCEKLFPLRVVRRNLAGAQSLVQMEKGDLSFNNYGFRDDQDIDLNTLHLKKTILCIGDSTTLGSNISSKKTYAAQLEKYFALKGSRVKVINAGIGGHNLNQIRANADRLIPIIKPDALVVGLLMNDADMWPKYQRWYTFLERHSLVYAKLAGVKVQLEGLKKRQELSSIKYFQYLNTHLDPVSAKAVASYTSLIGDMVAMTEALESTNNLEAWNNTLPNLKHIKDLCDTQNIDLVVAIIPVQFQLWFGYQYPEPQKTIRTYLESQGIVYIDLRPIFAEESTHGRECYFYNQDMLHMNSHAHEVTAKELLKKLTALESEKSKKIQFKK